MSEWKEYRTTDLLDQGLLVIGDGYRAKNIELSASKVDGLPFARVGNINGGFNFQDADYFPINNLKRVGEKISKVGDVVFTSKGTVGRFAYVNDKSPLFVYSPQLCFWRSTNQNFISPMFLFYWMQSREFSEQADAVKSQTDMADYVNLSDQRKMKITLPEINIQTAIAEVLSSLDDKIDLLHRQNKTLEQLAQTLFKQWFVEEAEEEWEEISLYDAIELVGGGTPKTSVEEYWNGNIKWLSGGDIASNHKNFVTSSEKTITGLGLRNSSAKLLPKFSTVISARGTVGKYCLLSEPMAYSQSNYGILPKFTDCFFFTYLLVAQSVDELQSAAYGSVFDTITTNTFKGLLISLPKEEDIIRFNESMKPFFYKILTNQTQIRTLTALRDTLLPKLMSGEIRLNH